MNKITSAILSLILFLLFLPLISASPEPITILTLHYNGGDISYVKETSTLGYVPSIYEGDYELRIFSKQDLISLNFLPPVREFEDGFKEDTVFGGLIEKDNFDFSLIIPKISSKEEKIIIQPNGKEVKLKKQSFNKYFILLLLILIIIPLILLRKQHS